MNAKNSDSFRWIVDRVYDKQMMTKKQVEALKDFGNLRNAIAHGRYFDDELLAFPHPKAVEQIEKPQALLTSPLQALSILAPRRRYLGHRCRRTGGARPHRLYAAIPRYLCTAATSMSSC